MTDLQDTDVTGVRKLVASVMLRMSSPITKVTQILIGGLMIFDGTPQTLSGAGAIDITSAITWVVTTGANALTLADGAEGQRKFIVMKTDGGDGTLTPTSPKGYSTIVFDDVGDSADLLFTNGGRHFMGGTATVS